MTPRKEDRLPFYIDPNDPPSKREVLKAALRLFTRHGLCETSIRDIAKASGYSNTVLYKYFRGKDELALHLFEQCYQRLLKVFQATRTGGRSFDDNLETFLRRYTAILEESLDAVLFITDNLRLFWPQVHPGLRSYTLFTFSRQLLEQGTQEGRIRQDIPLELLVMAFVGVMSQVARARFFGEFTGDASTSVSALRALLQGMLCG